MEEFHHLASSDDRRNVDMQKVKTSSRLKEIFVEKQQKSHSYMLEVYHPTKRRELKGDIISSAPELFHYFKENKDEERKFSFRLILDKMLQWILIAGYLRENESKCQTFFIIFIHVYKRLFVQLFLLTRLGMSEVDTV